MPKGAKSMTGRSRIVRSLGSASSNSGSTAALGRPGSVEACRTGPDAHGCGENTGHHVGYAVGAQFGIRVIFLQVFVPAAKVLDDTRSDQEIDSRYESQTEGLGRDVQDVSRGPRKAGKLRYLERQPSDFALVQTQCACDKHCGDHANERSRGFWYEVRA